MTSMPTRTVICVSVCGLALMLAAMGCGQAGGTAATSTSSANEPPAPRDSTANDTRAADADADNEAADQLAAAAKPAPPQRVYRTSVETPRYDDRRLADLGIHRYESKHLILYTDIEPDLARPLPRLMDQAYAAWEAYFGPLPPDRDGKVFQMIGFIMADRALFRDADLI